MDKVVQLPSAPLSKKRLQNIALEVITSLDIAEATQKDYLSRLDLFFTFFKKYQYTLTSHTYLAYKRFLERQNQYTVSTKNKYLIAAKVFLSQYAKMYGVSDPTVNVKVFSQSKKHKVAGVNDAEMDKISEALSSIPDTAQNLRVKAIMTLLSIQGLRQIEVVRLDVSDIDFISCTARVQGKGRDDTDPVDLHPTTVSILKKYVQKNKIGDGPLFYSKSNNSLNNRLTTRTVQRIVKNLFGSLDISKTTHGLRHWYITKLLKVYKGDLLEVANYSRHRSFEMLQVYQDKIRSVDDLKRYFKVFEGVNF